MEKEKWIFGITSALLFVIVFVVCMAGCDNGKSNVVTAKFYRANFGGKMPAGICRFSIGGKEFEDSCHFYKIGDTINSTQKH